MTGRDDVTVGELDRRLDSIVDLVKEGFAAVNKRFDDLNVVHRDVYDATRQADKAIIEDLKNEIKEIKDREWGSIKLAMGALGTVAASVLTTFGAVKGIG